jgi:ribosomal protein S27E
MSGRATSDISAQRRREVWRRHDRGEPARAIARKLRVTEGAVRYYLRTGRPRNNRDSPARLPTAASTAVVTRPRDTVIAGSARTEHIEYDWHLITVRCGGCGHEQETRAECHTSTCKACGRTIRLDHPASAGQNIVRLRSRQP